MRSLTCVVLLFTVFSLVAVSAAQQASPSAAPKLIDDSDPLPLPAGMMTEAVAGSTPAKLLPCVAEGTGYGVAIDNPPYLVLGLCMINTQTGKLNGDCLGSTNLRCNFGYEPSQCPVGATPKRRGPFACIGGYGLQADHGRQCTFQHYLASSD